jgi:hypothetical protein
MLGIMVHEFDSELVQEFYNSCHNTSDGRFCGRGAKGKKVIRVPMSDAARRSNAMLRRLAADRRSKEYKNTRRRLARDGKAQPNKDGSKALPSKFKTTGDRKADAIAITRLDRGSAERKAAVRAFGKRYGNK